MINEFTTLHQIAMEFVDEARLAAQRGENRTARLFFQKAYNLEKVFALAIPLKETYQLTRSVFLRSAATLALDSGFVKEAISLLQLALTTQPHPAIETELRDLLAQANASQENKQGIFAVTGRVVSADLPNHQIKLQPIDHKQLVSIQVPEGNFSEVVRTYWERLVTVEGTVNPDGSIVLESIQQAA